MSYFSWRPYVPVAKRQREAERELAKLAKRGMSPSPVKIEGRKIANSFWGKSWCENLERYSDFASRLPRGRSYVRNGLVVDLKIERGEVIAKVSGSELYTVKIRISPVKAPQWRAICRDCAGSINSLVELLQGRLARRVMERVCSEGNGLFPAPEEIALSCSCPDWADMCKHVAAALYGVGARLDEKPELLFVLRNVDEQELLVGAGDDLSFAQATPGAKLLDNSDVAALFGLEMAETVDLETPSSKTQGDRKPHRLPTRSRTAKQKRTRARAFKTAKTTKAKTKGIKKGAALSNGRSKAGRKPADRPQRRRDRTAFHAARL
jgi:uncharacterized Zn finger protein